MPVRSREDRIAYLQTLLEKEPGDPFTNYTLGLEYAALQDLDKAASLLEQALTSDPDYVPAYHQLALICLRMERKEEALTLLQTGMRIAKKVGDDHAFKEMLSLTDELI